MVAEVVVRWATDEFGVCVFGVSHGGICMWDVGFGCRACCVNGLCWTFVRGGLGFGLRGSQVGLRLWWLYLGNFYGPYKLLLPGPACKITCGGTSPFAVSLATLNVYTKEATL